MTTGSLIVAGILVLLIAGSIASIIWEKRSGKCSCGSDCGCCDCGCGKDEPIIPKD